MAKRERLTQLTLRLPAAEAEALANEAKAKKLGVAEVARRRISETYETQVTKEQIEEFGRQIVASVSELGASIEKRNAELVEINNKLSKENKIMFDTMKKFMLFLGRAVEGK